MKQLHGDVAIIGGGLGGVAAALALTDRGLSVVMTEEFPWIGGQVSSQALCVLDDLHDPSGEKVGITRRYADFRRRVREYYSTRYRLSELGAAQLHLCPGNARCSHLTAEPNVAHQCLLDALRPAVESGKLTILTGYVPISAQRSKKRVESVMCRSVPLSRPDGIGTTWERVAVPLKSGPPGEGVPDPSESVTITADFFLDATETGDTYPLLGLPYRLGSEARSEFNEPHAPDKADRRRIQSFTYCLMVEFVPGGNFTITKPAGYERIRDEQGFALNSAGATPEEPAYFFRPRPRMDGQRIVPFWFYRCVIDAANFAPGQGVYSRAVINVASNDYHREAYLENPRREEILEEARQLSRAYLYWLQTEAPRDEGGHGYPELRPLPECTGTPDGLALGPYVREGRRLAACRTIVEQDLSAAHQSGARARHYPDAVGLGAYAIDIHRCSGDGPESSGVWQPARPYQTPLSALIPPELENFAAAGKGIGVTQIANGAYRLHPVEWGIGEAAGELAAFCLGRGLTPQRIAGAALREFQRELIGRGISVYWYEDLPFDHPGFAAVQILAVTGIWPGAADHLRFDGEQSLVPHRAVFLEVLARLEAAGVALDDFREMNLNAHNVRKYDLCHRLMKMLDARGWPELPPGPPE